MGLLLSGVSCGPWLDGDILDQAAGKGAQLGFSHDLSAGARDHVETQPGANNSVTGSRRRGHLGRALR